MRVIGVIRRKIKKKQKKTKKTDKRLIVDITII